MPQYREYDTYDPSVEGTIVGLRVFKGEAIEVVVENERRKSNKVAYAHITVSQAQSGAVQEDMPGIEEHGHWIFDQMPDDPWPASATAGVMIYDATPTWTMEEEPLHYPDPLSSYATIVECLSGQRPKRIRGRARKKVNVREGESTLGP